MGSVPVLRDLDRAAEANRIVRGKRREVNSPIIVLEDVVEFNEAAGGRVQLKIKDKDYWMGFAYQAVRGLYGPDGKVIWENHDFKGHPKLEVLGISGLQMVCTDFIAYLGTDQAHHKFLQRSRCSGVLLDRWPIDSVKTVYGSRGKQYWPGLREISQR